MKDLGVVCAGLKGEMGGGCQGIFRRTQAFPGVYQAVVVDFGSLPFFPSPRLWWTIPQSILDCRHLEMPNGEWAGSTRQGEETRRQLEKRDKNK